MCYTNNGEEKASDVTFVPFSTCRQVTECLPALKAKHVAFNRNRLTSQPEGILHHSPRYAFSPFPAFTGFVGNAEKMWYK